MEPGSQRPAQAGAGSGPSSSAPSKEVIQKKIEQAKKTGVLALRECGLKALPPAAVAADASSIRTVDLGGNSLNALPDGIGAWTGLQNCLCEQAGLSSLPVAIGRLASLQKLALSGNRLRTLPLEVSQLGKLRILQLNGNQLGPKLPEAAFGGNDLPRALEELELKGNGLEELPATLGGCTALVRLILAQNQLRELPAALSGCTKLQYVDAADNKLTSVPSGILETTNLSELWLKGNPVDRLQLQETPGFAAFLERRKVRLDHKIETNVVGRVNLAVCGLD